jgi:hypothetical protein
MLLARLTKGDLRKASKRKVGINPNFFCAKEIKTRSFSSGKKTADKSD